MTEQQQEKYIESRLARISQLCDGIKALTTSKDFPFHKGHYGDTIGEKAAEITRLAGQVQAIHDIFFCEIYE